MLCGSRDRLCGAGSELVLSEVEGTRPGRAQLGKIFEPGDLRVHLVPLTKKT